MAKSPFRGAFSPIRRIINEDYKPADEHYHMGGTVVPSVVTEDPESSGVRFPVHAEKLTGTNLVIEKDGEMRTIHVSARAMEILREGNKDGKRMNYDDAIKMAAAQEEAEKKAQDEKREKESRTEQEALNRLPLVEPPPPAPNVEMNANIPSVPQEPEYMKAQRAEKPSKRGRKARTQAAPAHMPKIPVTFNSSLGIMSIMAERVFVGGPNNICLVIIQYSPEGHFFVPPQVDEPVMISFQGQVYKCLTGIYYQLPGTPVMHTVYFIAKE